MLNKLKIYPVVVIALLCVCFLVVGSFAWYHRAVTLEGANVTSGDIKFTFNSYAFDTAGAQLDMIDCAAAGSDVELSGQVGDPSTLELSGDYQSVLDDKNATFFFVVFQDEGSIDLSYALSFRLMGMQGFIGAEGNMIEGSPELDPDRLGGFDFSIREVKHEELFGAGAAQPADVAAIEAALATYLSNTQNYQAHNADSTEHDSSLARLDQRVTNGDLVKAQKRYAVYSLTINKNASNSSVTDYTGLNFDIEAKLTSSQRGEGGGNTHTVLTASELEEKLKTYEPGDVFELAADITYNKDLTFNLPVKLALKGHRLTVLGNLTFDFNAAYDVEIDTTGGGQILVRKNAGAGGNFKINAPSSKVLIKGTNNQSLGKGDIYVQGSFTVAGSYSSGVVLSKTNIYHTADGEISKELNVYKPILLGNGTSLTVTSGTTVGSVTASSDRVYKVAVFNNGTIAEVNFANMYHNGQTINPEPQIYLYNNYTIKQEVIILPAWSTKYDPETKTGNTRIIQDLAASAMSVTNLAVTESNPDPFQKSDIEIRTPKDLVVMIDDDPTKLLVRYFDKTEDGIREVTSLQSLIEGFYAEHPEDYGSDYGVYSANMLQELVVEAGSGKYLTAEDYAYLRTMKKLTCLDLSKALAEVADVSVPVGYSGTVISQTVSGNFAYIPNSAFSGMSSLTDVRLPDNTQAIFADIYMGTKVDVIYLPEHTLVVAKKPYNRSAFFGNIDVRYIFIESAGNIIQGIDPSYHYCWSVPEDVMSDYVATYGNAERFFPTAQIDTSGEYLVRKLADGRYELVYHDRSPSATKNVNNIGDGIWLEGIADQLDIVSIGKYAFYNGVTAFWHYDRNSGVDLVFADSVERIGDYAFYGATINSVELKNINYLGTRAFENGTFVSLKANMLNNGGSAVFINCTSLTDVQLGDSTYIGAEWFVGTTALTSLHADAVETVGSKAFLNHKQLATVELPACKLVEESAFSGCSALENVDLRSVEKLMSYAITGCSKLQYLYIPNATHLESFSAYGPKIVVTGPLAYIHNSALSENSYVQALIIDHEGPAPEGFSVAKTNLSAYTRLVMSQSAADQLYGDAMGTKRVIEDGYFDITNFYLDTGVALTVATNTQVSQAKYLLLKSGDYVELVTPLVPSVDLNASPIPTVLNINGHSYPITAISEHCFTSLTVTGNIVLGSSMTAIGDSAFSGTKVTGVTIPDGSKLSTVGAQAFYNVTTLVGGIDLPATLTSIGSQAFYGTGLTRVTFDQANTNDVAFGSGCFHKCSQITSVILPKATTVVPSDFVRECGLLKEFVGEGVTTVQSMALYLTPALSRVYLPKAVIFNGSNIIQGQTGTSNNVYLERVDIGAPEIFAESTFNQRNGGVMLIHGVSSGVAFNVANPAGTTHFAHGVIIAEYGNRSIYGDRLKNVFYLPEGLSCDDVQEFTTSGGNKYLYIEQLNGSLYLVYSFQRQTVASGTFLSDMAQLESSTGKHVTAIGDGCFTNTSFIGGVVELPEHTVYLGEAFSLNKTSVVEIQCNAALEEISAYACYGMTGLTSMADLDRSRLEKIGDYAFMGCTALADADLPDTVTSVGSNAFRNCSSLKHIVLPEGVKALSSYTFYGCSSLLTVEGVGVLEMGDSNFGRCVDLVIADFRSCIRLGASNWDSGGTVSLGCNKLTLLHLGALESCGNANNTYYAGASSGAVIFHGVSEYDNSNGYYLAAANSASYLGYFNRIVPYGSNALAFNNDERVCTLPQGVDPDELVYYYDGRTVNGVEVPSYIYGVKSDGKLILVACLLPELAADKLEQDMDAMEAQSQKKFSEIATACFYNTKMTGALTIHDGVTEVGLRAFYSASFQSDRKKSLTHVFTNDMLYLRNGAFGGNTTITYLILDKPFVAIQTDAVGSNVSLQSVTIMQDDPTVAKITGPTIFKSTVKLYLSNQVKSLYTTGHWCGIPVANMDVFDRTYTSGGVSYYYQITDTTNATAILTSVVISDSSLTTLTIPDAISGYKITQISANAFASIKDNGITTLKLPKDLAADGLGFRQDMFLQNLTKFDATDCTNFATDSNGVLYTKDMTTVVLCPMAYAPAGGVYTLAATATGTTPYAFAGCRYITKIIFP